MHPTHSRRGAAKPKGALGIALHYLNLQAESRTWRRELAKPHEGPKRELSKGTGQLFGISSATQLREMLGEFQDFGTRILALDPSFGSAPGSARVLLLKELHRAAALSVDAFVVDRVAGCLGVSWGTQKARAGTPTFTEVVRPAPPAGGVVAEVLLRNGWVVRVPLAGADAAALRTLLRGLDAPC